MVGLNPRLAVFALALVILSVASCREPERPVVGSAMHHDVSQPLRDILIAQAAAIGEEEQWIEMPLLVPPSREKGPVEGSTEGV